MAFTFSQGDRPLPGYTILRGVGRGGFGEVYYATSDGGKEVALKFLRDNPAVELRGVQHCLNLKSPYLVGIHDIRQNTDSDYFVVMEFVNGPSLRDLMNESPNGLGPQKAAYLTREIGKGLAYLHDRGIVHRDLKPGNIFYEDGYVKIGDYGLAKMMAASQHSGQTVSVGTVHYMAPEVGSGNYDRTIDIYALGVMLYEMLLGRVPFAGATMGEVLMKHLTAQPAVDELPAPFPDVIRKALAKDPKDRYQTVPEFMADLFSIASLDESVAAFEPNSLSNAARRVAPDINATLSAGPRRGGGGAVALGDGSSNIGGPVPPPIIPRAVGGSDRFGGAAFGNEADERRDVGLAGRLTGRLVGRMVGSAARGAAESPGSRGGPIEKLIIGLLIMLGLSVGVAFASPGSSGSHAVSATINFMAILAVVQAAVVGVVLGYHRLGAQGVVLPRAIMVAAAWLAIQGLDAMWGGLHSWAKALPLVMLLCKWEDRVYEGRRGVVSLGSAIYAGTCGLICGAIFTNQDAVTIGGIAAAASLAVQSLAGLFPLAPGERVPLSEGGWGELSDASGAAAGGAAAWPADAPRHETSRPDVAVDLPTGEARRSHSVAPLAHEPAMDSRGAQLVPRSAGVRALWLLAAAVFQCAAVMCFASQAFIPEMQADERAGTIISGIVCEHLFLYALTRSFRRYRIGLWRGVIRPGIFFIGTATASAAGATMGLMDLNGEGRLIALGFALFGAMMALFVWFVPSPPPIQASPPPSQDEEYRRQSLARRLKWAGLGGLGLTFCLLIIFVSTLNGRDIEDIAPPTCIPLAMASSGLLVAGFWKGRRRRQPVEKLSLPIKCVFDVDESVSLSSIMERHMALMGYHLDQRSELLWCFMRGQWLTHFWHQDIRRWKTRVNIAAYRLDAGGYRVTCRLDIDADFNQPSQKMLAILKDELVELQRILDGRDVVSPFSGEVRV